MAIQNTPLPFTTHCNLCHVSHEGSPMLQSIIKLLGGQYQQLKRADLQATVLVVDADCEEIEALPISRIMVRTVKAWDGMLSSYRAHLQILISHLGTEGVVVELREPGEKCSVHVFNFV